MNFASTRIATCCICNVTQYPNGSAASLGRTTSYTNVPLYIGKDGIELKRKSVRSDDNGNTGCIIFPVDIKRGMFIKESVLREESTPGVVSALA